MFEDAPSDATNDFYNNVCLSSRIEVNATSSVMQNNVAINNPEKGWQNALSFNFSAGDFSNLSEDAAKEPRGEDGSLPKNFARLNSDSKLIDQGITVDYPALSFIDQPLIGSGLAFQQNINANGRDLGPYEYSDFLSTRNNFVNNQPLKIVKSSNEIELSLSMKETVKRQQFLFSI